MNDDLVKQLERWLAESETREETLNDRITMLEEHLCLTEEKLAMAVESFRVIEAASRLFARDRESDIENVRYAHECTRRLCVTTLAELKGQADE